MQRTFSSLTVIALLSTVVPLPLLEQSVHALTFSPRAIDGTGNNTTNTEWGSANIQLIRKGTSDYVDNLSSPSGDSRPGARVLSNSIAAQSGEITDPRKLSDMTWQWGQFVDHDIDFTDNADPKEPFNISVPAGDTYFDPLNTGTKEIDFNRSVYDPTTGATNPREQINQITAFLDGSGIYGSDSVRAQELRTKSGGKLKTSAGNLLPFNTAGLPNAFPFPLPSSKQFLAGDVRVNEHLGLISMHTLWVREHNRLAEEILASDTTLSDEHVYQIARRKVIALLQAITYEEWIPALFGSNALPAYTAYNSNIDPSISNEFSTAAFRLGHSMLSPKLLRLNNDGTMHNQGNLALKDAFFRPDRIQFEGGIDPILKGLASQKMQKIDTKEVDDIRNFLFGPPGAGGFDLVSLNIQRGRDHGLPGYNQLRRDYGLSPRSQFPEITSDTALAQQISTLYGGDIENVDPWVGGLAEDPLPGSSVGELFTAIILDQFTRLRDGDRFWYEAEFSGAELSEIKSTSLADVIHRNTGITTLQDHVFFYKGGIASSSSSSTTTSSNSSTTSSSSSSSSSTTSSSSSTTTSSSSNSSSSTSTTSSSVTSASGHEVVLDLDHDTDPVAPGQAFQYHVKVTNPNSAAITKDSVKLSLDLDTDFLSADHGGKEVQDGLVEWTNINIPGESFITLKADVRVSSIARHGDRLRSVAFGSPQDELITRVFDGHVGHSFHPPDIPVPPVGTLHHRFTGGYRYQDVREYNGSIHGPAFPPIPNGPQRPIRQTNSVGELMVDRREDRGEVQPGSIVSFTIQLRNLSNAPIYELTAEEEYNPGTVLQVVDIGGGLQSPNSNKIVWHIPELGPSESLLLRYTARVSEDAQHGQVIRNAVTVQSAALNYVPTDTSQLSVITHLPQTGAGLFAANVTGLKLADHSPATAPLPLSGIYLFFCLFGVTAGVLIGKRYSLC